VKDVLLKYKWPLIAAAAAVALRWIYLFELSALPGFDVPMVDEKWHWEWAGQIIGGPFWGDGAWFRAPLYPYFLAFLSFVTGGSIFFSKLLQLLLCGGTAFFIYRLGDVLVGHRAGLIAAFIYAVYGTLWYYEAMFLIPVLFLFFIVWGMYRLIAYTAATRWQTWLLTGLIFGLAAISRPNILLVMPVLMLWVLLAVGNGQPWRVRLRRPLLLLAGLAIAIAPVTARNIIVTGEPILISSQGGINLYLANNRIANGLSMKMPEVKLSTSLTWSQFQPATHAAAERETGRSLTEAEASSFWTGKALSFIAENPGTFMGLVWRKCVYLASGFENSDNSDIYFERGKSSLYSLVLWDKGLVFPFGLLFPLALAGIYLRRRDARKLLPLYLFIVAYIPTIVLFLVTARHRLPLVPFLMIIAAAGVVTLIECVRQRRMRDVIIAGAIVIVGLLLFNRTYYEEGGQNKFQIHFNSGIKAERLGDYIAAETEFAAADRFFPYSASLLTNLAHAQFQNGKIAEADRTYSRALAEDPRFHRALNNLGLLVESKGMVDSARILYQSAVANFDTEQSRPDELGQIYINLGGAWEQIGNLDSASSAFDSSMAKAPILGDTYFRSAAFFARIGDYVRSDNLYTLGRKHHSLSAADLFNWGLSNVQRRNFPRAIELLSAAIKQDSTLYQAYYLMGISWFESGEDMETVLQAVDRALYYNPGYAPAIEFRNQVTDALNK